MLVNHLWVFFLNSVSECPDLRLLVGAERVQQSQVQHGLHHQNPVSVAHPPGPAPARESRPR